MCRGCFACTPRHDRGGAYAARSSPLKQGGGNHNSSLCCLFALDIASNCKREQATHPLACPGWLPFLVRGASSAAASCPLIAGCSFFDSVRQGLCQRGFLSTRLCFRFIFHSVTLPPSSCLFEASLFVCYRCPQQPREPWRRLTIFCSTLKILIADVCHKLVELLLCTVSGY